MSAARSNERGRLAIVTGAAAGIGRATAEAFLADGYACLLLDRDRDALAAVRASWPDERGERLTTVATDLLAGDAAPLDDALRRFEGHTLHLVNNLGGSLGPKRPLDALAWSDFEAALRFNLKATIETTRAVLPRMKAQRRGWIVNVASMAGRASFEYIAADYAAAKAALLGLTRAMARELADAGILVNAICPGITGTARIRGRWAARSDEENARILEGIPLGRLGTPEEVARGCFFLGSTQNEYITGAVLDINGGAFLP